MWHLKCLAFWCCIRIFSSSNSLLQYQHHGFDAFFFFLPISNWLCVGIYQPYPTIRKLNPFMLYNRKIEKSKLFVKAVDCRSALTRSLNFSTSASYISDYIKTDQYSFLEFFLWLPFWYVMKFLISMSTLIQSQRYQVW